VFTTPNDNDAIEYFNNVKGETFPFSLDKRKAVEKENISNFI
jgi:hypothetical protein